MDFTPHADANPTLLACAGEVHAATRRVANLSSQVVAVGGPISGKGIEHVAAGARELVAVPSDVVERGVDGVAGDTAWDV